MATNSKLVSNFKLSVNVPKELHRKAKIRAAERGITVQHLVQETLASALDMSQSVEHILKPKKTNVSVSLLKEILRSENVDLSNSCANFILGAHGLLRVAAEVTTMSPAGDVSRDVKPKDHESLTHVRPPVAHRGKQQSAGSSKASSSKASDEARSAETKKQRKVAEQTQLIGVAV